jgi:uncharacterized membrane protein
MDIFNPNRSAPLYALAQDTDAAGNLPGSVICAACTVPVLVLSGFALMAVIPVTVIAAHMVRNSRSHTLRWPAAGLVAAYALPLIYWLARPDGAASLTKDLHPASLSLIVAMSLLFLSRIYKNLRA